MSCYCHTTHASRVEPVVTNTVSSLQDELPLDGVPAVVLGSTTHQPDTREFDRALTHHPSSEHVSWPRSSHPVVADGQLRDLPVKPDIIITAGTRGDEIAELIALTLDIPLAVLSVGSVDESIHRHSQEAHSPWFLQSVLEYHSGTQPDAVSQSKAYPTRNCILAELAAQTNGIALAYWDGTDTGVSSAIDTAREHGVPTHAYQTPEDSFDITTTLSEPCTP